MSHQLSSYSYNFDLFTTLHKHRQKQHARRYKSYAIPLRATQSCTKPRCIRLKEKVHYFVINTISSTDVYFERMSMPTHDMLRLSISLCTTAMRVTMCFILALLVENMNYYRFHHALLLYLSSNDLSVQYIQF